MNTQNYTDRMTALESERDQALATLESSATEQANSLASQQTALRGQLSQLPTTEWLQGAGKPSEAVQVNEQRAGIARSLAALAAEYQQSQRRYFADRKAIVSRFESASISLIREASAERDAEVKRLNDFITGLTAPYYAARDENIALFNALNPLH